MPEAPTRTEQMLKDLPMAAVGVNRAVIDHSHGGAENALLNSTSRDPDSAINEEQHELLSDVREIFMQVQLQGGVIPATLLYMRPWPITYSPGSSGPHNEGISIPACPIADEYVPYIHRSFRRDFGDRWGRFKVKPVWPIQIIQDIANQHKSCFGEDRDWGGVVAYMGDTLPGQQVAARKIATVGKLTQLLQRTSDPEMKAFIEASIVAQDAPTSAITQEQIVAKVETAMEKQIVAFTNRYEICNGYAADKSNNGFRSITRVDRLISSWLWHRKIYQGKQPEWVTQRRPSGAAAPKECPKCSADLTEKGYACVKCGRVDKPYEAFLDGEIKADNPAMKRCTREQLDSLGLKDVLTLEEERLELQTSPEEKKKGKKAD
jgi:hypothetical protein